MKTTGKGFRALLAGLVAWGVAGCGGDRPAGLQDEELAVLIDSLTPGIAASSGLEVRQPVQYRLQPRDDARAFMERQLEEELGHGELEAMSRAYTAFGLLPDTLDLRSLLLELLAEQVIGYYDPATDHLYVVEGVRREDAAPVVAHELVHALQDQHVDLDSLIAPERGNDRQMAAQAAAEGQAMLIMMLLQAEQMTGQRPDPARLPDLATVMGEALEAQNQQYPVFGRSPRIIRETMVFPYVGGAAFLQALYRARPGSEPVVPFGDLLPQSTEQVLSPEARFLSTRDAPTELRLEAPGPGWDVVYENNLGQLEVSILLSEYLGTEAAGAAEGWDGDRYALLAGPGGAEALVWYSVWDDDEAADRFADTYRRLLDGRAGWAGRVERVTIEGRPGVRVVQTGDAADPEGVAAPEVESAEEGVGL